ncbi:MAG: hypothetical protein GTO45_36565 [Candidatus Aminicenantes bacterium]|nr:hypothetical protein [Candidatus Aminicenantes bacterium]NIM84216.1 hypothetical protein [Candidatus Aminicenantes bacterium]NIN23665.1 hypothetical protein [Candidatus Aminicenantes bacterium]NIN47372.1 hypothetical protein [Candidatus Aminicenantes bacterium]NIN90300.1 hypothetical protein [Candidatus Aminicenantes bacterium]
MKIRRIESCFPCICGEFSLAGRLKGRQKSTGVEVFFSAGNLVIYRLGAPDIFFKYRDQKKSTFVLVQGQIYEPFYLGPGMDKKKETLVMPYILEPDLKTLQGSFIIIDYSGMGIEEPKLVITVDKYGMRTVFYYQNKKDNTLYFATHISGIKFLLGEKMPTLSSPSVIHYYHFGFTSCRETLFRDILKIPPASTLTICGGKVRLDKYVNLSELYNPGKYRRMSEFAICTEINRNLETSIQKRVGDKKTLAVALSGGVDSGLIAKKAREMGISVAGYNLAYGLDGLEYDESSRVNRLAGDFDIALRKIAISPRQLIENIEPASSITSEPIAFNDAAMAILFAEAAKDGLDSLWDGDGVDRLFFGMNRHMQYHKLFKLYNRLKPLKLVPQIMSIIKRIKGSKIKKLTILLNNWLDGIPPYPERKLEKNRKYDRDFERYIFDLGIKPSRDSFIKTFPADDVHDMILYFTYQSIGMCPEIFFHSPLELLQYYGMTPVSPFWTDSMVSLALSIPSYFKVKKGKTKYILRKAASIGHNRDYWMLRKIGLQNSYNFIKNTSHGREWQEEWNKGIKESLLYGIVSDHLQGEPVEIPRLLMAYIWFSKNNE